MGQKEIPFEQLENSDLYIDCIYKGGKVPNISSEPFHKLIPGCENSGGFRKNCVKMVPENMHMLFCILQWKS